MKKYRVLVCGTTYGQVYLSAFLARRPNFRLAGILGKGSLRSKQYARQFGVPYYHRVEEVPGDIDIACVVVRSTIAGGEGTFLAKAFLQRGMHVIQEHPVHAGDIAACLELAEAKGVCYHVNSHYVHVEPVTRFIDYLEKAREARQPLFIEATASLQTLYSLSDIIGRALGGVQPYALTDPLVWDDSLMRKNAYDFIPFTCLQGVIKGIPATLKIQNYHDPQAFDNHFLVMHRVSIGTTGGSLTLVNTHGPVVWSQAFSIEEGQEELSFGKRKTAFSGYREPTAISFNGERAPALADIAVKQWPAAIHRALEQMKYQIESGRAAPGQSKEYLLDLSGLWLDITRRIGAPRIMKISPAPAPVPDPLAYAQGIEDQGGVK
ncbi:Gfo/Idh/MocA family oxidoreductase [Desulforamulus ruminis]